MPTLSTATVRVLPVCRDQARPLYYFVHRAAGTSRAGEWTMLSGLVRSGENAAHAAARIMMECTGLLAQSIFFVSLVHTSYEPETDTIQLSAIFVAEIERTGSGASEKTHCPATLLLNDYDEVRWIRCDAAMDLVPRPDEKTLLAYIHDAVVLAPDRGASHRVTLNG